ncbi:MAG: hypothetical protein IKC81_03555 [Paludibacteraceae bacterium]|nr:hypothetical protein [Paludibacteraceae bacterium]
MKKICLAIAAFLSVCFATNAANGVLDVSPKKPSVDNPITLVYSPSASQQWMQNEDVYIYVCLEMDQNGEWVKEKAEWSKCNQPNFKWTKKYDGELTYTISNIKSYFGLTDAELPHVTGLFVILKNDKYQTADKYIALTPDNELKASFNGTVKFRVQVPVGTEKVYVAGTFGKEGDPLYWKHADARLELKKVDNNHFEGVLTNVPANLQYLYVWGPRTDQAEFRLGHRPLGSRSQVNDIVDYWGDMTLNVTVPHGTQEMYVAGNFSNWTFIAMMDAGNDIWTYHVPPTALDGKNVIEYKYYSKDQKEAVEKGGATRKVKFEGFTTQYDEIKAW